MAKSRRILCPIGCAEDELAVAQLAHKDLSDLGFNFNSCMNWNQQDMPAKPHYVTRVQFLIKNYMKAQTKIQIGPFTCFCHGIVLRTYAEYFREADHLQTDFILDPEEVSPASFVRVYEWMMGQRLSMKRDGFIELFKTASYLRVFHLMDKFWLSFDDNAYFNDDKAFLLYLDARGQKMEWLQHLMLRRVGKFFLHVVASKEFVDMTAAAVCSLLSANAIGINTEMEVFMAAVRWLIYDWENRKEFADAIMRTVRFNSLPLVFLLWITKYDGGIPEIAQVVTSFETQARIYEGVGYNLLAKSIGVDDPLFFAKLKNNHWEVPEKRLFVYDERCEYHLPKKDGNRSAVTVSQFCEYMNQLKYGSVHTNITVL